MDKKKQSLLKKNGWKIGSVSEFLKLTQAETKQLEAKLKKSTSPSQ